MKLWITYAWKDNNDGDFDYLVQELAKVRIKAVFDRIALIPGQRLWQQIGDHILNGGFDGWAYLVTPASLNSEPCKEELEYAVTRALQSKSNFPLLGLIHGVSFNDLPASLRSRLYINLNSADWKEQVRAALEQKAPKITQQVQSTYVWRVSETPKPGGGKFIIVEIKPRFGELMFWRIGVPENTAIKSWGYGPANGTPAVSGMLTSAIGGAKGIQINGTPMLFNGAGDKLSPGVAAKIVFENMPPAFIAFGISDNPFGMPNNYEVYKFY